MGRAQDLEALSALFDTGERLVTILGPPGMGKTRLATEWAARRRPLVLKNKAPVFCDLRGVTTREGFTTELAKALEIHLDEGDGFAEDTIAGALAARGPALVLLDNCEEGAREGAPAVARLLDRAPHVRFLVTSRALLRLRAEVLYELGPLSLPASDLKDTESDENPWSRSEALHLFGSRARAAEPTLDGRALSVDAASRVVHKLDGVPLAIELAASQLRRKDVATLDLELTTQLLTVEAHSTDIDERHRTLRAAIDHSIRLLSLDERRAFAELSVFRNGFDLEAATSVLRAPPPGSSILDRLTSLREASLVRAANAETKRWDLLESLRHYATDELRRAGGYERIRARHAAYYLAVGEAQARRLRSAEGLAARWEIHADLANHQAAFETWLARDEPLAAMRMALVLHAALIHWMPPQAVTVATRALASCEALSSDEARVLRTRLLLSRATARRDVGDMEAAAQDLSAVETLLAGLTEPSSDTCMLSAELLLERASHARCSGFMDRARAYLRGALAALEDTDRSELAAVHLEGRIRSALAIVLVEGLRDEAGLAEHNRAVALLEATGDLSEVAWARSFRAFGRLFLNRPAPFRELRTWVRRLHELGLLAQESHFCFALASAEHLEGHVEIAERTIDQASNLMARLGLTRLRFCCAFIAGPLLEERGKLDDAGLCYEEAIRGFDTVEDRRFAALARIFASGVLARQHDRAAAQSRLEEARRLLAGTGDKRWIEIATLMQAPIHLADAELAARAGHWSEAAELRGEAQRLVREARRPKRSGNVVLLPLEQCSNEARKLLRLLDRSLERTGRGAVGLQVSHDGRVFSLGHGPLQELSEGPMLQRLLVALSTRRIEAPGTPLTLSEILEACWQGERMRPHAAQRRVRNLVWRLRQTGLERIILTGNRGGYLLDPAVPVDLVPARDAAPGAHRT